MRSSESKGAALGAVLLAAFSPACEKAPSLDSGEHHRVVADIIVSVTNQGQRQVMIYVGSRRLEHSLGMVLGRSTRLFSLPSDLGQSGDSLHFEARPGGSISGTRSGTFSVSPGEEVRWSIGEHGSGTLTKR